MSPSDFGVPPVKQDYVEFGKSPRRAPPVSIANSDGGET